MPQIILPHRPFVIPGFPVLHAVAALALLCTGCGGTQDMALRGRDQWTGIGAMRTQTYLATHAPVTNPALVRWREHLNKDRRPRPPEPTTLDYRLAASLNQSELLIFAGPSPFSWPLPSTRKLAAEEPGWRFSLLTAALHPGFSRALAESSGLIEEPAVPAPVSATPDRRPRPRSARVPAAQAAVGASFIRVFAISLLASVLLVPAACSVLAQRIGRASGPLRRPRPSRAAVAPREFGSARVDVAWSAGYTVVD